MIEIISVNNRSNVLVLYQTAFALGFLMVPGFSYLTRTWNGYWLMIALPSFFLLPYHWYFITYQSLIFHCYRSGKYDTNEISISRLIPESPRWFLAHGKVEEARQVLLKAAKWNKISPETVNAAIESHEKLLKKAPKSIEGENEQKSYGITDLLQSPTMRMRTVFIAYNWFKDGLVFYGLEYYLGRMSENVLTNLAISGTDRVFELA